MSSADPSTSVPPPVAFPWRLVVYSLLLLYLLWDLGMGRGPMRQWINSLIYVEKIEVRAERLGYAAAVNSVPIRCVEVERAAREQLARSGRMLDSLQPEMQRLVMKGVLQNQIRSRMVSRFAELTSPMIGPDEVGNRIDSYGVTLPGGTKSLEQRQMRVGWADKDFRKAIWRGLRDEAWLEHKLGPSVDIPESEVARWFEENQESLRIPERVRVRHLFLTTADPERPNAEAGLRALHARLKAGESFTTLAEKFSDDPRSQKKGGDLGWISRERVPEAFAEQVFLQKTGVLGPPFKTPLGWHVAIVEERQPSRLPTLAEVRAEVHAQLVDQQREKAIEELLTQMEEHSRVIFFEEVFESYLSEMQGSKKD